MRVKVITASTALMGVVLLLVVWSVVLVAGQEAPSAPVASSTSKAALAGQWHLNKELSTMSQGAVPASDDPGAGRDGAGGGRRPGGGVSGPGGSGPAGGYGGGMGGRGGGGMGGRGGAMGGGMRSGVSDDMLKMRALMRAFAEPADLLTILVSPSDVTLTDQSGIVTKLKTDGKKDTIDFGPGARLDTKTKWDGDVLTLDISAGSMKVGETYQVITQGNMMVITIQPPTQGNARSPGTPIKYVYQRPE